MDANRRPRGLWGLCVIVVAGCTVGDTNVRPQLHVPPKVEDPPQVAATQEPSAPGRDELTSAVEPFVTRVTEAADKRSTTRPVVTPRSSDWPPIRYAADEAPASQPAATIQFVPQYAAPIVAAETELPMTTTAPATTPSQGPILGALNVRSVEQPIAAGPEPSGPAINTPAFARHTPADLREFIERMPAGGEDSFRSQLDRRMLWVMAGDYDKARQPLNMVTAEQQELAQRFVAAQIVVRDWHMGDQSQAAAAASRELAELQRALQKLTDLSIPTVKICSAVRGYGQYDVIDQARLYAGASSEFVLYCELSDFVSDEQADGWFTTSFDMTTSVINRVGDTVYELKDPGIVDRCRNRRRDCFIPRLVRLPATLSPGQYTVKVTIIDKLGERVAENRTDLQLVARQP
jgi:hypothetical protein